jgi:hypothetical protein
MKKTKPSTALLATLTKRERVYFDLLLKEPEGVERSALNTLHESTWNSNVVAVLFICGFIGVALTK